MLTQSIICQKKKELTKKELDKAQDSSYDAHSETNLFLFLALSPLPPRRYFAFAFNFL